MTRQTRTLLVLGAMAVLGLSALLLLADRYGTLLERRDESESRPPGPVAVGPAGFTERQPARHGAPVERFVEGFIAVRQMLVQSAEGLPTSGVELERQRVRLRAVREAAVAEVGMSNDEYRAVLAHYRDWRDGTARGPFAEALELRRGDLERLDLGPYDSLD